MRIDLYGPAATAVANDRTGAAAATATHLVQTGAEDTATLSAGSLSVSSLVSQSLATAEPRGARVEALRQAISSGAYDLDPGLIAEALVVAGV